MYNESSDLLHSVIIHTFDDVLNARKKAREILDSYQYSTLDQTKFITAISELLRNVIIHAGKGQIDFHRISKSNSVGIRCVVSDSGPGISDVTKAMMEGYSSVGSLGLGLSGAKNLSDDFKINSTPGSGTTIQITKWK